MKKYRIQFNARALDGRTQYQEVLAHGCEQFDETSVELQNEQREIVAFLYFHSGIIAITEVV